MTDSASIGHVRIPGYEIRKEIGRGGVATVYLAIQESLDREVALKIMSPALAAEPNFTERFIREGRTIAQLAHPGIVTIYDISVADYQHYIAMEYLRGGSLKQRMHKPIAPAPALSVLRQVTAALGYAHSKGFVHRDVKPENIIFRDPNTPVLTDFGIAKQTAEDSETHLTSIGVIVGTPRYMSPEQADGRGTDPRSDIYALGVLLYEMLSGRPPFDAKESIALLYSHINDPIPQLPEQLDFMQPLVNDLLAKEPDRRVQDCQTLVERIRQTQREVRDTGQRERVITPPASAVSSTAVRSRIKTLTGKRDGPWRVAAWTGMALAVTFILAAVIRGIMENDEVANDPVDVASVTPPLEPPPVVAVEAPSAPGAEPAPAVAESKTVAPAAATPPPATKKTPKTPLAHKEQKQPIKPLAKPLPPASSDAAIAAKPAAVRAKSPAAAPPVVTPEVVTPKTTAPPPVSSIAVAPSKRPKVISSGSVAKPARAKTKTRATGSTTKTRTATKTAARGWVVANDEQIAELLQRAQKQFDQERLSHPPGDNALQTYRTILKSAPDNPQAKAGLQRVADRYLRLAKQVYAQNKFNNAMAYVERGLTAVPGHVELQALKLTVGNRIRADKDFAAAEKLYFGKGIGKDQQQAVQLYQSAADKGHVTAQYHLAVAYGNGQGIAISERQALRWLQVAAAQGNFDAQYNLALGLVFGPKPEPQTAARWVKELAERNYQPAFRLLGWMYTTATGVEHSITRSVRWIAKGVLNNPVGPAPRPDWVVAKWQQQFDVAYERDVGKSNEEIN